MKKDKEWLKNEINNVTSRIYGADFDTIRETNGLIDQLDEPDKPVIPQFVADYIEKWEHEGLTMYEWFTFGNNEMDYDIEKWLYNNTVEENRRREYLLFDAIRFGYKVEKEKRYQVKIPITVWDDDASELKEHTLFLAYDITSGETRILSPTPRRGDFRTYLTEQEIKAIDKRYWAFAEEVTE